MRGLEIAITVAARFGGKTVNLIVFLIVARALLISDMAIYGYIFAITLTYSTVFDLGVRNSLAAFIGKNSDNTQSLVAAAFLLWSVSAILSVPIIWVTFWVSGLGIAKIEFVIPSSILLWGLLYIRMLQGSSLGKGDISLYNKSELFSRVVLIGTTSVLLLFGFLNLLTAVWSLAISQISAAIYLFLKQSDGIFSKQHNRIRLGYQLVKRGFPFMLSVLEMNLARRIAFLSVTSLVSPRMAGAFFALQRLTEIMTEVGTAVSVVIFSHNVRSTSNQDAAKNTAKIARLTILLFVIISFTLAISSPWSVPVLLGKQYAGHTQLFLLLLLATLAGALFVLLLPNLAVVTSPILVFWTFMPGLLLNAALTYPLVSRFGAEGAALAMFIGNVVVNATFLGVYKKKFGIHPLEFLIPQKSDFSGLVSKVQKFTKKRKGRLPPI